RATPRPPFSALVCLQSRLDRLYYQEKRGRRKHVNTPTPGNFWQTVAKPILILAPMEDVTDTVLRQVIARCGKPTVFFTEFTNVEGMFSKGAKHVVHRLQHTEIERPLVAQIWGSQPENFFKAAQKLIDMGFSGIDLNMGCPAQGPVSRGVCSGLINDRTRAKEIIEATQAGAAGIIPVSVKTRLGFRAIDFEWIQFVLEQKPAVLTVHLRTVSEMSKVPARWDKLKTVVEMRNAMQSDTLIIGNGDLKTLDDSYQRVTEAGADGAMIGRGIFDDPYIFSGNTSLSDKTPEEKMQLLLDHMHLWSETWGTSKHFPTLRKFFKVYANGFPGAQDLRIQLMETQTPEETEQVVAAFLQSLPIHS
ncbi:MAG TPA: tRNA-dihydrouridine synthase, partial [Ktedonobacteraceae bacterium]